MVTIPGPHRTSLVVLTLTLGHGPQRSLPCLNTIVQACHGKSSSFTYIFPPSLLWLLVLVSAAFAQDAPVPVSAQVESQEPAAAQAQTQVQTTVQTVTTGLPDRKTLTPNEWAISSITSESDGTVTHLRGSVQME